MDTNRGTAPNTGRGWPRWPDRCVAFGLSVTLAAGLLTGPAQPASAADAPSAAQSDRSVPVTDWRAGTASGTPMARSTPPQVRWPVAATRVVDLPTATNGLAGAASLEVGGLPVTVVPVAGTTPTRIRVEGLGRGSGPLPWPAALRASWADGGDRPASVRVRIDYSRLRGAYGGDWAGRLRLARIPDCVLAPSRAETCPGPVWLASENDTEAGTVSAQTELTGEVLALLAEPAGENGDFTQTDLMASYSWAHGGPSGDFTWSYPIEVPDVPGGLTPSVGLGYTSGAVDGQTAGQNAQPSWVGEGWGYSPPYIERTFRPCFDDRDTTPNWTVFNDRSLHCWRGRNAHVVFDGKATEIIRGDNGVWRLAEDDGEAVSLLTGADNGDDDGEHWRITATDGTQYWFGRHDLPGGRGATNSAALNMVYANHSGDACYSSVSPHNSKCRQAYRWMLDYVVDPHGNEIVYRYSREGSMVGVILPSGPNSQTGAFYTYHRSIRPTAIEYGTRVGDSPDRVAPARVVFTSGDRCLQNCLLADGKPRTENWPDTPWDLQCDDNCSGRATSYFSSRRLARIQTQVRDGGAYRVVDQFDLTHQFPATGNSTSPVLWLESITRTAVGAGGSTVFPPVTFTGTRLANQAFKDPNASTASRRYRLSRIDTETGGRIEVVYNAAAATCLTGTAAPSPHSNSRLCFPRRHGTGLTWWHKYTVAQVTEKDLVAGSPDVVTSYAYGTTGASTAVKWAHNRGSAVWGASLANRTWSDWRGWPRVTVTTGTAAGGVRSQTDSLYFRGLHGDRADDAGASRTSQLTDDIFGSTFTDNWWRAGQVLQARTFDAAGGTPVELVRRVPTQINTGTRTTQTLSPTTISSYIARVSQERSWEWNPETGAWAAGDRELVHTLDDRGRVVSTRDLRRGTCTRVEYAPSNATRNLYELVSREQVSVGNCTDTPAIPADLLSDTRHSYDGLAFGATPTRGDPTRTEVYGQDGWFTESSAGFDAYGRETSNADGLGRSTTTAYTHTGDGRLASIGVTNPAGHASTTMVEPRRGLPTSVTDANGKTTTAAYDHAGRLLRMWAPGRPTSGTPTAEYGYSITKTAPPWTSRRMLGPNGNQIVSYEIYDGLLRVRQNQDMAPDGRRVITDTGYDHRGLPARTSTLYNAASGPTPTLVTFADSNVERQDRLSHDGRDRVTSVQRWSRAQLRHESATSYGYRSVTELPPPGGTVTRTSFDGRGNLIAHRQYHTRDPGGPYDESTYGYDPLDRLTRVDGPDGSRWTYRHDLAGRLVSTSDPDSGTSTIAYDAAGQPTRTTDARGTTLAHAYDSLGRQTAVHHGSLTGARLAEWRYDTLAKGQLTSAIRYHDGLAYPITVTGYDDGYRPLGHAVTIPASPANGALAGTYAETMTYRPDGSPATVTLPGVGGLPAETITHAYTDQGRLASTVGLDAYLLATAYRWDDSPSETRHGPAGRQVRQSWAYDDATGRVSAAQLDVQEPSGVFTGRFAAGYDHDAAGNVVSVTGRTNGTVDRVECFRYDHLRRLTEAWTQSATGCGSQQTAGTDPYRRSWTFDTAGNRLTQTDHDPAGNTTWTYQVGTAHGVRPHQLARVTAAGPKAGAAQEFAYDQAGNMTRHTTETGVGRVLAWDAEGSLASVTANGQALGSYVYDVDGGRLITREPGGTTLHLGSTEVRQAAGEVVTAVRHYGGAAVRTSAGLFWSGMDRNGTPVVQTAAETLTSQRRRLLPYGEPVGDQPNAWQGSQGYVGGTVDGTGLTQLGVRGYDPALGRFTSDDPVMDLGDPVQWHGYAYANNSPVTFTDPDGLKPVACGGKCANPAASSAKAAAAKAAAAQAAAAKAAAARAAAAKAAAAKAAAARAAAAKAAAAKAAAARAAAAKAAAAKARQAAAKAAAARAAAKAAAAAKARQAAKAARNPAVAPNRGTGGSGDSWNLLSLPPMPDPVPGPTHPNRPRWMDRLGEVLDEVTFVASTLGEMYTNFMCDGVYPVLSNPWLTGAMGFLGLATIPASFVPPLVPAAATVGSLLGVAAIATAGLAVLCAPGFGGPRAVMRPVS